jgi:hypothetical protein
MNCARHGAIGAGDAGDVREATLCRAEPPGGGPDPRAIGAPTDFPAASGRSSQDQHLDAGKSAVRTPSIHAGDTIRIEEALGVVLRKSDGNGARAEASNLAPGELGFYSRPAVSWLEGLYLTLRPSFSDPQAIFAYRTEICWDDGASSLIFRESERVDAKFSQQGLVSVPHQSGYIYLVTNRQGQYRLIIISRPTINREMFGIMTTLRVGRGSELIPVSSPIAYVPLSSVGSNLEFGRIDVGHACYQPYRKLLKRTVEEPFALFLQV